MTCPFNKYKDILGIPKSGIHKFRFLNTAIMDYIFTIIAAALTTYLTKMPLVLTTIIWLVVGIIFHMLFGVETNTLKYLGFSCK